MDASATDHSRSALLRLGRSFCWSVLVVGTLVAVAGTAAQLLSRTWWLLELATHFVAHWTVMLVALTAGWALLRRWKWVALAGLCLVWQGAQLVPLYLPSPIARPQGPTMRLLSQNVFTNNENHQAVLDLVAREDPDIVILIETNRRWVKRMEPLEATYPHTLHQPSRDNFGISIYSKRPWISAEVVRLGSAQIASLVVKYDTPEGPLQLIATHTVPPVSAAYAAYRNHQLLEVAKFVASSGLPTMVAGDLNSTPWSPAFHDLLDEGNLRNTQRGHGVAPTWTLKNLPGIPIDHVLVTEGIAVGERRVGPQIGSDHRGVIVDFAVEPQELR